MAKPRKPKQRGVPIDPDIREDRAALLSHVCSVVHDMLPGWGVVVVVVRVDERRPKIDLQTMTTMETGQAAKALHVAASTFQTEAEKEARTTH